MADWQYGYTGSEWKRRRSKREPWEGVPQSQVPDGVLRAVAHAQGGAESLPGDPVAVEPGGAPPGGAQGMPSGTVGARFVKKDGVEL